jgi:hypothetical protein
MRETYEIDDPEQTAEVETTIRKSRSEESNVPRPRDLFECGRHGRLSPRCVGAQIVIVALGSTFLSWSIAEAATCLASADEVRKLTPKAWPRWTYGPNRERCWYSGEKPVFAKGPPLQAPVPLALMPQATTETPFQDDSRIAEPVKQPWALEYRWSDRFEIRHQARDEPLTYWVDDGGYDSYGVGRSLRPSQ